MSVDYDSKSKISIQFFKSVQNKIYYIFSGKTAAEVISHRANAEKDFIGLKSFSGEPTTLRKANIAKNYLNEKELSAMEQLVSGYLNLAKKKIY